MATTTKKKNKVATPKKVVKKTAKKVAKKTTKKVVAKKPVKKAARKIVAKKSVKKTAIKKVSRKNAPRKNNIFPEEVVVDLIRKVRVRGFVTFSELIHAFPYPEKNIEGLEGLYQRLDEEGIEVKKNQSFLNIEEAK